VRRIAGSGHHVTLLILIPPPSDFWPPSLDPSYSIAEQLKNEGYSEGTVGSVQTFFVGGKTGAWTAEELQTFVPVDTLIHLSRQMILRKSYPGVDVMTTRARLLDDELLKRDDIAIARGVRDAIGVLRAAEGNPAVMLFLERARKLQPFSRGRSLLPNPTRNVQDPM